MTARPTNKVAILGIFVSDLAFSASRMPIIGETIIGSDFNQGPGGKGANQAVAAARAGADTDFITKLGKDGFGDLAIENWKKDDITAHVEQLADHPTGAAFIFLNEATGENAIIVVPGAAATISVDTINENADVITNADVFITQLEQPAPAAFRALEIAREAQTTTIFNPAPAEPFPDKFYQLCDYITPNESEAAALCGIEVNNVDDAKMAANILLDKGVGTALITLGETGALFHNRETSRLIPSINAGKVIDTTGAGDAFNGAFAAAIARGEEPLNAVNFANMAAGIAVTRRGTAPAMPTKQEILAFHNQA